MYTFGQYMEDEKKDAKDEGEALGEARGKKEILLAFIRQVWDEAEADRCARELDAAALDDLPDIAGLLADQAAGRRPRLGTNGRSQPDNLGLAKPRGFHLDSDASGQTRSP